MVANSTLAAYVIFTAGVTEWRTQFLREKNRLENQSVLPSVCCVGYFFFFLFFPQLGAFRLLPALVCPFCR